MSLITQQTLLQAKSDRDDALHRISVGEDTPRVKQLLAGATKRIAKLEKQLADETAAATKQRADAATKAAESKRSDGRGSSRDYPRDRQERAPLPDDVDIVCVDCTNPFVFSGKDQVFFTKNGWTDPVRCTDCRDAKKNAKPSGKTLSCSDCGVEFFFTDAKSRVFEERGWTEPKRCKDCSTEHKSMAPITIHCGSCSTTFSFSVKAQKDFKLKGWVTPKTCRDCKAAGDKKSVAGSKAGSA